MEQQFNGREKKVQAQREMNRRENERECHKYGPFIIERENKSGLGFLFPASLSGEASGFLPDPSWQSCYLTPQPSPQAKLLIPAK